MVSAASTISINTSSKVDCEIPQSDIASSSFFDSNCSKIFETSNPLNGTYFKSLMSLDYKIVLPNIQSFH